MINLKKGLTICLIKKCNRPRDGTGHHIIHKGYGGTDGYWNRVSLCRIHHSECHNIGDKRFIEKYSEVSKKFKQAIEWERLWRLFLCRKINFENLTQNETEALHLIKRWMKEMKIEY